MLMSRILLPLALCFFKGALTNQLSSLKTECLDLISTKLKEAHEREMVQLKLLQALRPHPDPTASSTASSTQ